MRRISSFVILVMIGLYSGPVLIHAQSKKIAKPDIKTKSIQIYKSVGPDFNEELKEARFYNPQGQLTSIQSINSANSEDQLTGVTFYYNSEGDLREENHGTHGTQYIYAYDDPLKIAPDSNFTRKYYDEKGSLIRETGFNENGELVILKEMTYTYDQKGRVIQSRSYDIPPTGWIASDSLQEKATWKSTSNFKYNEADQIVAISEETPTYTKETRTRYNPSGKPVGTVVSLLGGGWMTRYSYNLLDELILEERFKLDKFGRTTFLVQYMHYTYYSNYQLQSIRTVTPDGKESLERYTYTYYDTVPPNG